MFNNLIDLSDRDGAKFFREISSSVDKGFWDIWWIGGTRK
jgi:hypothetical protein